jgi:hypothetical protein
MRGRWPSSDAPRGDHGQGSRTADHPQGKIHRRIGERHAYQHQGFQAEKPDLTLTINRSDLEQTMSRAKTLEAQIADGTAKIQGDARCCRNSPQPWWILIRALRLCPGPNSGQTWWPMRIRTRRCRDKPSRNRSAYSSPWRENRGRLTLSSHAAVHESATGPKRVTRRHARQARRHCNAKPWPMSVDRPERQARSLSPYNGPRPRAVSQFEILLS